MGKKGHHNGGTAGKKAKEARDSHPERTTRTVQPLHGLSHEELLDVEDGMPLVPPLGGPVIWKLVLTAEHRPPSPVHHRTGEAMWRLGFVSWFLMRNDKSLLEK